MKTSLALLLSLVARPVRASAQPRADLVSLTVRSDVTPTECPDHDALRDAVTRRLGRDAFAADAARHVEVRWLGGRPWRARIRVATTDAPAVARHLSVGGEDCAPLADAVILAVTLAIDPDWTAPVAAPVAAPPTCPVCPAPGTCPPAQACRAQPPPARPALALRLAAGVSVGLVAGVAASLGLEGEVSLGRNGALRVAARFAPGRSTDDGAVRVGLARADLGGCLQTDARVSFGGCAGVTLGALDLGALAFIPVAPGAQWWAGAWLDGRVELRAFAPWTLGLQARITAPFVRYEARVEGVPAPSFTAPPVAFEGEVTSGVRFW